MPASNNDWKRDSQELVVLSVLNDRPLYGYAIIKQVRAQSEGRIRLTPGVLYPLLHELEGQKLVTSDWEAVRSDRRDDEDQSEGRKRKWYRLTAKGRKRLAQRIRAHRAHQEMIESFLPTRRAAARLDGGGAA